MSDLMCPICNSELHRVTGDYETVFVDDLGNERTLPVRNVTWDECSACHEVFLDDEATQRIEAARLQALRRLSPSEIRKFRESLRKSQIEMAKLLGLGEKTFSRWESGAYIQNAAFDRYLRVLMANPANVEILTQLAEPSLVREPQQAEDSYICTEFPALERPDTLIDAAVRFTTMLVTGNTFEPCYT